MKARFADALVVAIICVQQQISMVAAVGMTVDTVTITTDSGNPGDGAAQLAMTLYWGDFQYQCTNTPVSGTNEYSCDSNDQSPHFSQDSANPYYLKLEYSTETAALQINTITITDSDGDWYAFDAFCIPPGMTHTMDAVVSGSTTGDFCVDGWQSKVSYDDLAIAGDTKFILLYVDFKIFGDRFANTVNEAGVRPPILVGTGYTVLGDQPEENVDIMIQWDTTLYTTRLSSVAPGESVSTYDLSTVTCGGVESAFTVAYYAEHSGIVSSFAFVSIYFQDETNRRYTLNTWCLENPATVGFEDYTGASPYAYAAGDCTAFPDHIPVNGIKIADGFIPTNPDLAPVLVPSTIFEFPDRTDHGVETEVLTGYFVTTAFLGGTLPDITEFCWERPAELPCIAPYGIPGASGAVCPETAEPTSDPTAESTAALTNAPTRAPTTMDPTRSPTIQPTRIPSPALADSCSVDVSLTQFATSSDCETTCWNWCAGASCDGYAVNSWAGHVGTVTNTMLMDDGNVYDEFIVLHPPNNGIGFGEYQLDGSYTRLTGLVGQARSNDNGCASGGDWHFIILADGVVKFTSQQFNAASASQYEEVDIDISGATVLRLESYADGSWGCDWATIADPTLWECASCDASEIATFSWDAMTTSAAAEKPEVLSFDMAVNDVDLSLNIAVKLTYEGKSSADIYGAVYGTTYVLDFEDFDAHADSISAPGTCQNRVANDFAGLSFDSLWSYSTSPLVDIGTAPYLAYPPPGDFWTISMADDDSCGAVVYSGKFTWNDLVACQSASGSTPIRNYITASEDEASGKLNLEGTFYVNVVSPYAASGDTGFYRVYQLLSQPFIISVNKNIQVLKGAGINLFTISVIAVYKEEQASLFKLIVLTESAEYLQLSRTGVAAGLAAFQSTSENSAPLLREFTVADSTENDGCLNNKDYICSQLWQIEAPGDCSSEQSQYIDFSGDYTLQFTPECRAAADLGADGVALHDYCSGADGWLATHGDLVTDGIGLTATLQWRDEECDPLLFEVQFEAEMLFYTDAAFATVAPADTLYQVGEDRVYIVVDTEFPDATYDVFDTTLLNVWICTFDPLTPPAMPIEPSELSGGCFSTNIDGYVADSEFGTDNAYAYHIFDSQATVSVPEIIEFELVGHPSTLDSDKDKLQFSFVVPPKIARDTLYIHAQIEVSLTTVGGGRRRMLLGHSVRRKKRAAANQMSHFLGNIGVSDQAPPQNPKPLHHEPLSDVPSVGGDHYVLSLQSPLVLAFAGLLAVILTLNIVYMAVRCCGGGERATVSLGGRSKRNYKPVNVESEVDDSEAHLNVVSE